MVTTGQRHADEEGKKASAEYAARLRTNSRIARQVVLLTALYARTDQETLRKVRKALQPWTWLADVNPVPLKGPQALFLVAGLAGTAVLATAGANLLSSSASSSGGRSHGNDESIGHWIRGAFSKQSWQLPMVGVGSLAAGGGYAWNRRHSRSLTRAQKLQANVRVVKRRPVDDVAGVLDLFVKGNDHVETIRCASFDTLAASVLVCQLPTDVCPPSSALLVLVFAFQHESACRQLHHQAGVQGHADWCERAPKAGTPASHRAAPWLPVAARVWRLF